LCTSLQIGTRYSEIVGDACNIDPQMRPVLDEQDENLRLLHRPHFLEKVAARQRRRAQLRSNDESDSGCDNDDDFDYTPFGYSFDPDYGDEKPGIHYQPFDDPNIHYFNDDDAPGEYLYNTRSGPEIDRYDRIINRIIYDIRRSMTRIDEGEPAIIGWRICDCYDPWAVLYQDNAYRVHGMGSGQDGGPIAINNTISKDHHNTSSTTKSNGFGLSIISSTWGLSPS
jgi:hypothetical protein